MVAIGLMSFLGQLLLTVSLKVEEAGKVSIIRKSADILFAFAFQIIIFEVSCSLRACVPSLLSPFIKAKKTKYPPPLPPPPCIPV